MKSGSLREEDVEWLLSHRLSKWHRYLRRIGMLADDSDDPIPADLMRQAAHLDFGDEGRPQVGTRYPGLATLLRDGTIPGKTGRVSSTTENEARKWINWACQSIYWQWIERSAWRSPLLVMDEAHHARTMIRTSLALPLRANETARRGWRNRDEAPAVVESFDRMLFLTATPFQLGHHELIRVLRSFSAAKWSGPTAAAGTRESFSDHMDELEKRLNQNRMAGRRLDRLWGRLARDAVAGHGRDNDASEAAAAWWRETRNGSTENPIDRELLFALTSAARQRLEPRVILTGRGVRFDPGSSVITGRRTCPLTWTDQPYHVEGFVRAGRLPTTKRGARQEYLLEPQSASYRW